MIRSIDGKLVPLRQIAKVESITEPASAWSVNAWPAIRISASAPSGTSTASAAARIRAVAEAEREKLKLTEGYQAMDVSPAK
jgi:multidrug efflux pump subunit AcrB